MDHVVMGVLTKLEFHQAHCYKPDHCVLVGDDFIQDVYELPGGLVVTRPLLAPVFD